MQDVCIHNFVDAIGRAENALADPTVSNRKLAMGLPLFTSSRPVASRPKLKVPFKLLAKGKLPAATGIHRRTDRVLAPDPGGQVVENVVLCEKLIVFRRSEVAAETLKSV